MTRTATVVRPHLKKMARRAGSTISYFKAGHLGLISDPRSVTRVIERAAEATG